MKSLFNLMLISLITLTSISMISCCKPEGSAGKHHHSKMHHEHGDK